MLIKYAILEGIAEGRIDLLFRSWTSPRAKAGGQLRTGFGVLEFVAVELTTLDALTTRDAARSGAGSLEELRRELARFEGKGTLYRIQVRHAGDDPRIALRERDDFADGEAEALAAKLRKLDAASSVGPWTRATLELIRDYPATRSAELAELSSRDQVWLKLNIRKLKNLGLTVSLKPGYRLSPRGEALLALLAS
jgi:hypothetical protein